MKKGLLALLVLGLLTSCPPPVSNPAPPEPPETGGFTVVNSWGKGYWENVADGKYTISYKALTKRPVVAFVWAKGKATPKVLLEFTLSANKKSNLYLEISGASGYTTAPQGEVWTKRFLGSSEGYRFRFDSASGFSQTQVYYDITEVYNALTPSSNKIFVKVKNEGAAGDTLKVESLSLVKASDFSALVAPTPSLQAGGDPVTPQSSLVYTFSSIPVVTAPVMEPAPATLTSRFVTQVPSASEIEAMKAQLGTEIPGKNYNVIYKNQFGTGLKPPKASDYQILATQPVLVKAVQGTSRALPATLDWTTSPRFPPIGNQGVQGSCAPFNSGYYIQSFYQATLNSQDLSTVTWVNSSMAPSAPGQVMSPSFIYNLVNGGVDNGSSFVDMAETLTQLGAVTWQTMPYDGKSKTASVTQWPSTEAFKSAPNNATKGYLPGTSMVWNAFEIKDAASIAMTKELLAQGYLLLIGVDAGAYDLLDAKDQFTTANIPSTWSVNHANTLVGYDDTLTY